MKCLISNCTHIISRRGRMNIEYNSWGQWQICPCCANALGLIGLADYNVITYGCRNLLKKELHVERKPNQEEILRIKQTRKVKQAALNQKLEGDMNL